MALAAVVAVAIAWRIVATGVDSLRDSGVVPRQNAAGSPLEVQDPEGIWRKRLARNPADYGALLELALQLEREGKKNAEP